MNYSKKKKTTEKNNSLVGWRELLNPWSPDPSVHWGAEETKPEIVKQRPFPSVLYAAGVNTIL